MRASWMAAALAATAAACSHAPERAAPSAGDVYVAMGSSFAAGPGVTTYPDNPAAPCYRSADNYPRQLARALGLTLVDVSCSGATTAHLTGPRGALPPQLDALTGDTKLVTITIGGNDLGYIGSLGAASCAGLEKRTGVDGNCPPPITLPAEITFTSLAQRMDAIAKEVRRRAPGARLVFVDYLTVLPETGTCPETPLDEFAADSARYTARRLAAITGEVATANGADIIKASELSSGHDACSAEPWMTAYSIPGAPVTVPYHPNLAGMTAVARALEGLIAQ